MTKDPYEGSDRVLTGVPIYVRADSEAVEALGVVGGQVAARGTLPDVRRAVGLDVPVRALAHGALLPAFVDAHQHGVLVALDPHTDTLYRAADDIAGLMHVVSQHCAETGDGWLRLHGYEPMALTERRSPTARELDGVCPERPVHVISRTYHESVVNTAGLDALRISSTTPDPPGGRIVRNRRGRPTGVLLEAASFLAEQSSRPPFDLAAVESRLDGYARRLLASGITRIGDAAVPADLADWYVAAMARRGISVQPMLVGDRIDEPHIRTGSTAKVLADGGEYCHLCMSGRQVARIFADSSRAMFGAEASTARAVGRRSGFPRREGDGRWHTGIRFPEEVELPALMNAAAEAGAGLAIHAVGNGAVDAVLAALTARPDLAGFLPVRIEHAMVLDPRLVDGIAAAGVPVVAQPGFLSAYGHDLEVVPVPQPLSLMPLRTMLEAGIPVAFSSDFPAAGLSPWSAVADAMARPDGRGGHIHPDESLTARQAIRAYTSTAAEVTGLSNGGTLEVGSPADMQWVDADPFTNTDPRRLTVLGVWSSGIQVYAGR